MAKKDINTIQSFAEVRNETDIVLTLTDADTYYIVKKSDFINYMTLKDFTFDAATGKLTYTGTSTKKIAFWGESIFKLNSADTITYALFMNNTAAPNMNTHVDVNHANRTNSAGINGAGVVSTNDTLSIRVKCDVAGKEITINSLHILIKSMFLE